MVDGSESKGVTWIELAGEVIFILLGVSVFSFGWTLFGETMVIVGAIGLASWVVRAWRAKRSAS